MEPATVSPHFGREDNARLYRELLLPRVFEPWAKVLLDLVPAKAGEAVLDVATGPGTVARPAARLVGPGGRVTGVDVSPAMLALGRSWPAEEGAAAIEYLEASATSMPLPDGSFDVVYCQQGMQHMADPQAALREMRRVLRPGGRIGLAAWTTSPFHVFRETVARVASGATRPTEFGHDAEQLRMALTDAGFREVTIHTRQLKSTFEGGVEQAIRIAMGTSTGPLIEKLSPEQQQRVRAALLETLKGMETDGVVYITSETNIASARV